jgi:NAD-dependent deacetylase
MLTEMMELVLKAKPNPAHTGLAELERMGRLETVITQNVDGLHQAAGSLNVIELHGSNSSLSCLSCKATMAAEFLSIEDLPPVCPDCGSIMKPDVVFFGEPLPWEAYSRATEAARACDLIMVIGTSAVVYPAAEIPVTAKDSGAKLLEINVESTVLTEQLSDYLIEGPSGQVLPLVVEKLKSLMEA